VLALGALVALALLSSGGGSGSGGDVESVDGVLTSVDRDRLVIEATEPVEGKSELELVIRPEDAPQLNLPHLETHAAQRLGTRVYYERSGDRFFAVGAEDASVR
jgi:hypothetical protein